ncbi:hypothetical protein BDR04DRAFT_1118300 [Suillus decipiens]|nr:hypothetical protein BDR04DRAFT_1118300 [Suillus decipiens]
MYVVKKIWPSVLQTAVYSFWSRGWALGIGLGDMTLGSNVQATCDLTQIDLPADQTWCFAARLQHRLQPSDMLLRDSSNLLQSVMDSPRIALNGNKWNWRLHGLKACQMVDFCVQTTPKSMMWVTLLPKMWRVARTVF